jgi:hypothetical protein
MDEAFLFIEISLKSMEPPMPFRAEAKPIPPHYRRWTRSENNALLDCAHNKSAIFCPVCTFEVKVFRLPMWGRVLYYRLNCETCSNYGGGSRINTSRGFAWTLTANSREPKSRKKIGEVLVDLHGLDREHVEEAAVSAKKVGEKLGRHLMRRELITSDTLCNALASQFGLQTVDLSSVVVSNSLDKVFSVDVLKQHNCVPFNESKSSIAMAVSAPLGRDTTLQLEHSCGKAIYMYIANEQLVSDRLQKIGAP